MADRNSTALGLSGIVYAILLIFVLHDKEGHAGTKTAKLQPKLQEAVAKKESVLSSPRGNPWHLILLVSSSFTSWHPASRGGPRKTGFPRSSLKTWASRWRRRDRLATISIAIASFIGVLIWRTTVRPVGTETHQGENLHQRDRGSASPYRRLCCLGLVTPTSG